jgi:DNA ligase-1
MKEKSFKPQLLPNEKVDLSTLNYPLLASCKIDGIRCIFYKGQILSRSLKEIPNRQLKEKFEPIRAWTEKTGNVIDGEIYDPSLSFQEIVSYVMTDDLTDPKTIKKNGCILEIPETLNYYAFDFLYGEQTHHSFYERLTALADVIIEIESPYIHPVVHKSINNKEEVEQTFEWALKNNYEGLVLRNPNALYKFGRFTIKEGGAYKVKPFLDFDGQIIDVIQATEVIQLTNDKEQRLLNDGIIDIEDNLSEKNIDDLYQKTYGKLKKVNELGRSVTSKKKGDRICIDKASAFMVKYEGKDLKVVLSMTDEEKEEVWKNKESYIDRWISYKGMLVGAKDVPRHPVMIRFREPK